MKIQILDYSTHKEFATLFKHFLPTEVEVSTHYIDSKASMQAALSDEGITHVVHSGSSLSISADYSFTALALKHIQTASQEGIKQMGICYGHQLLCRALVGNSAVQASPNGFEAGWCEVTFGNETTQIPGLNGVQKVWQHHFDEVIELPLGSELIATATHTPVQAWLNPSLHMLGMQFHPEFDLENGNDYFLNDRQFIQQHGMNVDELIKDKPSAKHGEIWFDYFLNRF